MVNPGTGTAADLIKYKTYTPTGSSQDRLTRMPTSDQEWVFQATGGRQFTIKFASNFVKKHLFNYSKKTDRVQESAYYIYLSGGQQPGQEFDNWLKAEQVALNNKLEKTLKHRAETLTCACGHILRVHQCKSCAHPAVKHATGSGAPTPCKPPASCGCTPYVDSCLGKTAGAACACGAFAQGAAAYGPGRVASGKGDNPLAGAATDRNTSIVMNRVAKADFERVVVDSILAVETAAFTWALNTDHELKWDFGAPRKGCVVQVDLLQSSDLWDEKQGVWVKAKKLSSAGSAFVYQVFHMETTGAHAPF